MNKNSDTKILQIKEKLIKKSQSEWLLPRSARSGMNSDCIIFGTDEIIKNVEPQAIWQLTNAAMLPGIVGPAIAMPDIHWGYGVPVGTVAPFDAETGIISSGMVGFDINCGISLVRTQIKYEEIADKMPRIADSLYKRIPAGVGSKSSMRLDDKSLNEIMVDGINWLIKNRIVDTEHLKKYEDEGCIKGADPKKVSEEAKKRGKKELGTLGAGNHFLEIQKVDEIYNKEKAEKYGIFKGQIVAMIHTGSRGFGHQIATDYIKLHKKAQEKYNIKSPDPQLSCVPFRSDEGQAYFSAMKAAANYSFANKLLLTKYLIDAFEKLFGISNRIMQFETVYCIAHNICSEETLTINNEKRNIIIHRKGATRSYPKTPVIIAGSMGTSSYLLEGTEAAVQKSFASSAHGAGRSMSRHRAIETLNREEIVAALKKRGEIIKTNSKGTIIEEAPDVYKNIDTVIESITSAKISEKIARFTPLTVIKG